MVLQLVEEKKLKLTDTLDKYFPGVPNAKNITIAHMLGHRSGIHSIGETPEFRSLRDKGATPAELLALIEKPAHLISSRAPNSSTRTTTSSSSACLSRN